MSITTALGEPRTVVIDAGTIAYRESGEGPALVFVHGVGVNGDLWRAVVPRLATEHRCVVADFPFGSHTRSLRAEADLSLPGLARIVADFIAALDLGDVVIVANDTGGAVAQWLVGHHPERVAGLVLTSCDAFEKFPPTPQRYLELVARSRALMWLLAQAVRLKVVQRTPMAYGFATRRPIDPAVMRSYTDPVRVDPLVRRDLARLLRAVEHRHTFDAAGALPRFDRPALVLWGEHDRIFPRHHGELLAELLPQGRFELVRDSRTFIPEDQPDVLAARVRRFVSEAGLSPVRAGHRGP
jgi:pimeloyl-ACP methyl ester carboxylesterase